MGPGAVFAYLHDSFIGGLLASVCLIVGLTMIVASEAQGLVSKPGSADARSRGRKQARILVLVKGEVHVYPQSDGNLQENPDPHQTGLEFDVFIQCWLVLAAELTLRIAHLQLSLKNAAGSTRVAELIIGDLKMWYLREERRGEEESDWSERAVRKAPTGLVELDTATPLECGAAREGWLHFRIKNTTPSELKGGSLELSVTDSFSHTHKAVASKLRRLPGSIYPILANCKSDLNTKKDEPPSA
jgi:hypothetical protein